MNREKRKKRIQKISICAMLIGISVVVGTLCRNYLTFGPFIRITFENLPIILTGLLFGPVYGLAVGACTDLVSSVLSAQDINPIITLGSLAVGLCSGLASEVGNMLGAKPILKKISGCIFAHLIGSLIVKTAGLYIYYYSGTEISFWYLFGIRTLVYVGICAAECVLIILLLRNKYIKGVSNYEL